MISQHKAYGRSATVTAVQPPARFGILEIGSNSSVCGFKEKPKGDGGWINGGFFVLEPQVIDLIEGDSTVWEQEPLHRLSAECQLTAYKHSGFWQPMDTLRDKTTLENLWQSGQAPWKTWTNP